MQFAHEDALARLCRAHNPKAYLEVGVWDGDSLRVVLDNSNPARLALCDLWSGKYERGYADHAHIAEQLRQRGYKGTVEYIDGNSHMLLPTLQPRLLEAFDLILVDGDHTETGARADLNDCWPLLAVGGHLVFDDLLHKSYPHMLGTFRSFCAALGPQHELESLELKKMDGCGVIRKRIW